MVVDVKELLLAGDFAGMGEEILSMKLKAVESLVRSYTNNNFQNRAMRIRAPSRNGILEGSCPYFREGDTVQISQSSVNDGLYVITGLQGNEIRLDGILYDCPQNTVTKVEYPADERKGVVDLMLWEKENRGKVGIKSETLSRHTVTYFDQDSANQVMGYPVSLLGFLEPYRKARF